VSKVIEGGALLETGEVEFEVGARRDLHCLENASSFITVDDGVVERGVTRDGFALLSLLHEAIPNTCGNLREIGTIHCTAEIRPKRLDLSDTKEKWVHQSQDIESHFFRRESTDAVCLKLMSDDIGGGHEGGSSSPPKGGVN